MEISVTPKNIEEGMPASSNYCAIACAMEDAGLHYVNIDFDVITCENDAGDSLKFATCQGLHLWQIDNLTFDKAKPIRIALDVDNNKASLLY